MEKIVENSGDKSKLRYGPIRALYGEMKLRIMVIMLTPLDIRAVMCYAEVNSTRRGTTP